MPLESATFVADLVATNPPGTDQVSQGANHLRMIKSVLQATFPGASKAWPLPTTPADKSSNYSVQKADYNVTFVANTNSGAFTFTLPTLAGADAGWSCAFIRNSVGSNPYFVAPPSGTIISGEYVVSTARRCIPLQRCYAYWQGNSWLLSRVPGLPVGSVLDCWQSSLPVGYEWANGQTLASVGTNYPEYNSAIGSGVTPDYRNRASFGLDNMGGVGLSNRITVAGGNFDGSVRGNTGGAQNHTLTLGEAPAHSHSGTTNATDLSHNHTFTGQTDSNHLGSGAGSLFNIFGGTITTSTFNGNHTHGFSTDSQGGGAAHSVLSPAIIMPKIVVVE